MLCKIHMQAGVRGFGYNYQYYKKKKKYPAISNYDVGFLFFFLLWVFVTGANCKWSTVRLTSMQTWALGLLLHF